MFVDIYNTQKKYAILYVDPPWRYNKRNKFGTSFGGGVAAHYPTMSMAEIQKLPIERLAAKNCALFLWVTFPYLNEQIKLFDCWGFKYKTLGFSWLKTNSRDGRPFFGVGYYAKSNCEVCLLGVKGSLKPISNRVSSCIIASRRDHSRKPDIVRDKIVELFGDLPRIELFARQSFEGWDCWGNETDKYAQEENNAQIELSFF